MATRELSFWCRSVAIAKDAAELIAAEPGITKHEVRDRFYQQGIGSVGSMHGGTAAFT
jgi:hypothetical protein